MRFQLYPAIDLKDGQCVRLLRGEMDQATQYNPDPGDQAAQFKAAGFENLHVVDLNGAHASIQFSEFEDMQFRRELLDRSSLLRQALSDVQDDSEMTLAVPQVFLHSWLQWRTNENIWDSNFVDRGPQIVKFLEVSMSELLHTRYMRSMACICACLVLDVRRMCCCGVAAPFGRSSAL